MRTLDDPVTVYLDSMCLPLYTKTTRSQELYLSASGRTTSLANSPFPCEQQLYLEEICVANGTTELDFLAEQGCLCRGSYFSMLAACCDCFQVHGSQSNQTAEEITSSRSSLSLAECTPTPPYQVFSNLIPSINVTSAELAGNSTVGVDRFPNNTAVSLYFTATGRVRSWTNFSGVRYSPTSTPPSSTFASRSSTTPTVGVTSSASVSSASVSSSSSGNAAATGAVEMLSCLLAAGMGAVALL